MLLLWEPHSFLFEVLFLFNEGEKAIWENDMMNKVQGRLEPQ